MTRGATARGRFSGPGTPCYPAVPLVRAWFDAGWIRDIEQRRLFPWLAVAFALGILAISAGTQGPPHLAAPLIAAIRLAASTPLLERFRAALNQAGGVHAKLLG
jgi:competence protein ComEC